MDGNTLTIALAQMDVIAGQPSVNFEKLRELAARAKEAGADIVIFPEMCIGGYFLADRWNDEAFVDYLDSFNDRVRALSDGIGIVFGNVCRSYMSPGHRGKDGRGVRYNAALFARDGEWVRRDALAAPAGRYLKSLQPDYRMFDDERYFTSSIDDADFYPSLDWRAGWLSPFIFEHDGRDVRIGLEICEDLWSDDYAEDITRLYAEAGCDLIFNISASPWTVRKDAGRGKRVARHARTLSAMPPIVYVNCVGMQNNGKNVLSFDGGSAVYGSDGSKAVAARDDFEEDLAIARYDLDSRGFSATVPAPVPYADEDEKTLDGIVTALRRFDAQVFPFHPKWVIGLSGGIDSSVTAALMHLAFGGPERIVGYNLATRYNSDVTKMNAYDLATALGIRLVNGSIEALVEATGAVLARYGYPEDSVGGLAQENIQARLRGHMLSTFASLEGGVIMNNGNKVEVALGYATLYGDAIGAISPIGDVTKTRLFRLARIINRRFGKPIVPENLIPEETAEGYRWETMPSAELKDAQKDPMKWFYHDWLIEKLMDYPGYGVEGIMQAYLDDRLRSSEVGKWISFYGLDSPNAFIDDLEWVLRQMTGSTFKRIQMPPSITVTRGSFGIDFRENQLVIERTDAYRALREKILAL